MLLTLLIPLSLLLQVGLFLLLVALMFLECSEYLLQFKQLRITFGSPLIFQLLVLLNERLAQTSNALSRRMAAGM